MRLRGIDGGSASTGMSEARPRLRKKLPPFPRRALQKSYLGENPLGAVPLLIEGEARMMESAAIRHYHRWNTLAVG